MIHLVLLSRQQRGILVNSFVQGDYHDYLGFTPPGGDKVSGAVAKAPRLRIPLRRKYQFVQPRRGEEERSRMSLRRRLSSHLLLLALRRERSLREDMIFLKKTDMK